VLGDERPLGAPPASGRNPLAQQRTLEGFEMSTSLGGTSSLKGTETRIRPVSRSFFDARPAPPPRRLWRTQTVHRTRHLFSEHCRATPALMSHLWIAARIHQPTWDQSPGSGSSRTGARGKPLVRAHDRNKRTLQGPRGRYDHPTGLSLGHPAGSEPLVSPDASKNSTSCFGTETPNSPARSMRSSGRMGSRW
jgi:hypothetical protein